jgi:hypothetical protein
VDAQLCGTQATTQEVWAQRPDSVRVRLEMVGTMAQRIEFYVPEKFRRQGGQWIPPEQRGKIIPFLHRNRSLHDMRTLRLVDASDKSDWQANTGFCSPQCGSAYLDW